jgi:hypothetical protein
MGSHLLTIPNFLPLLATCLPTLWQNSKHLVIIRIHQFQFLNQAIALLSLVWFNSISQAQVKHQWVFKDKIKEILLIKFT